MLLEWPGGSWEATLRLVLTVVGIYLGALWLALVVWTYRDIRQRTRDPIAQTLSVLLVLLLFLPGHWIYLILRPRYTLTELYERSLEEEALLQELDAHKACPTCKRRVQDEFLICPSCRTQLKEPCRGCGRPLAYAWIACPYCGLDKPARERPAATRAGSGAMRAAAPAQPSRPPAGATRANPQAAGRTPPQSRSDPFASRPQQRPADEPPIIDATAE